MNEEDIKILEQIKEIFIHLKNYGWINDIKKDIDTDKAIQAIENSINRNKELEEDYTSVYLKGIYDERDKWKSKIKELLDNKFIVLYEGDAEFPDDATEINEVKYINAKYL